MVTSDTRLVLAVIVCFSGSELLDRWAQRMIELLQLHASGQACETWIVM
jgi:hypothetical protein